MFGMFYFITFFVQGVLGYSPLKTGFAFLPVALVDRHRLAGSSARSCRDRAEGADHRRRRVGDDRAVLVLAGRRATTRLLGSLLPGMMIIAVAMALPVRAADLTAVSKVAQHRRRAGIGAAQRRPAGRRRDRPVGDGDGVRHRRAQLRSKHTTGAPRPAAPVHRGGSTSGRAGGNGLQTTTSAGSPSAGRQCTDRGGQFFTGRTGTSSCTCGPRFGSGLPDGARSSASWRSSSPRADQRQEDGRAGESAEAAGSRLDQARSGPPVPSFEDAGGPSRLSTR